MPYINNDLRSTLDPVVDHIINALRELELDFPESSTEGNLNYIISRVLNGVYTNGGYKAINDAIGVLECIKQEYYRRVASEYENKKIAENGDVYFTGEQ
jgi:hypothetical protein